MNTATRGVLCLCVAAFLCSLAGSAFAQSTASEREEDLLLIIESLKERVGYLEDKVDSMDSQPPSGSPQLEQRLMTIEEKLEAEEEASASDFRVFWKDAPRFETKDGKFKLRIGGRIMADYAFFSQHKNDTWLRADLQDGAEFRRARIYMDGTIYGNISFKAQYDFAGGDADFKDVWMSTDLPVVGTLKIGHFKEPFSLEELTSSKYITFLERALPNAFAPSRNMGIQLSRNLFNERMYVAGGFFRYDTDDYGFQADEDSGWNFTARVTGLPWYEEDGRKMLHLGVGYSHQNPDSGTFRYRQRPEAHLSPVRFVDTSWMHPNLIRADSINLYNAEAALVYGPFSLQGEYTRSDVDSSWSFGDLDFDGWYVQGSYFLTGENRAYKTSSGTFDKIKPNRVFNIDENGWGAWELALRYSTIDLNSGYAIRGGEEDNITVGLNWYLNANTRVMFNYTRADIEHDLFEGDIDIFQTRFQFAF